MERRNAIIAMLAGTIGLMVGRVKAQGIVTQDQVGDNRLDYDAATIVWNTGPQTVTFDLDNFSNWTFHLGKETVTLSSAEVFAALKHK